MVSKLRIIWKQTVHVVCTGGVEYLPVHTAGVLCVGGGEVRALVGVVRFLTTVRVSRSVARIVERCARPCQIGTVQCTHTGTIKLNQFNRRVSQFLLFLVELL